MATRRRVVVPGSTAGNLPKGGRNVERGGPKPPFNPAKLTEDRSSIHRRQGGFANPGEFTEGQWTPPNQNVFPKSTTPVNPVREQTEADLFAQSDNAQFGGDNGDFIPLTYDPTKTSWPANGWDHRRTVAAGYSKTRGLLRIQFFTDGAIYDYGIRHPVLPEIAHAFRLSESPGKFIDSVLNNYGFARVN